MPATAVAETVAIRAPIRSARRMELDFMTLSLTDVFFRHLNLTD
jgi:hypothetical protein